MENTTEKRRKLLEKQGQYFDVTHQRLVTFSRGNAGVWINEGGGDLFDQGKKEKKYFDEYGPNIVVYEGGRVVRLNVSVFNQTQVEISGD